MLEEKLRASEEHNAALKEEIRSMKMVQVHQGKALEATNDEHKYPDKINQILEDLRIQKEQNRIQRMKQVDSDKSNLLAHENMVKLEVTIRQLKQNAAEQKLQSTKGKQNEKLNEAADKIDELVQANTFLNAAKDKVQKQNQTLRAENGRKVATLDHKVTFLTSILRSNNIIIDD